MDCAKSGVSESKPPEQTRQGHIGTRGGVRSILKRYSKRSSNAGYAFEAKRICDGIGPRTNEGLDQLRERVEASAGG